MPPRSPNSDDTARLSVASELRRLLRAADNQPGATGAHSAAPSGFRRLAEAIVSTDRRARDTMNRARGFAPETRGEAETDLTCEQCEDVMDEVVGHDLDGLEGVDIAIESHPLLWRHLERCDACWATYDLLMDTLSREREGRLPALSQLRTPNLPFLRAQRPEPASQPWLTRVHARIAGAPFGLTFSFNLDYLRTLLAPPAPTAVYRSEGANRRFAPTPSGPDAGPDASAASLSHLLLAEIVSIGDADQVAVEVKATRHASKPDVLAVEAIIASPTPLPQPLWARLTWAGQTRSTPVDPTGHAVFGDLSIAALQESPSVASEPGASSEHDQGSFALSFQAHTNESTNTTFQ